MAGHSRPPPGTSSVSACLSRENPRKFHIPVQCPPNSFLVTRHSTCPHGFNYRRGGGAAKCLEFPWKFLSTLRCPHGMRLFPNLNEQALDYRVMVFSSNFFVQCLIGCRTDSFRWETSTSPQSFSSCQLRTLLVHHQLLWQRPHSRWWTCRSRKSRWLGSPSWGAGRRRAWGRRPRRRRRPRPGQEARRGWGWGTWTKVGGQRTPPLATEGLEPGLCGKARLA